MFTSLGIGKFRISAIIPILDSRRRDDKTDRLSAPEAVVTNRLTVRYAELMKRREIEWIYSDCTVPRTPMKVRTCDSACCPNQSDLLATRHSVAFLHESPAEV